MNWHIAFYGYHAISANIIYANFVMYNPFVDMIPLVCATSQNQSPYWQPLHQTLPTAWNMQQATPLSTEKGSLIWRS